MWKIMVISHVFYWTFITYNIAKTSSKKLHGHFEEHPRNPPPDVVGSKRNALTDCLGVHGLKNLVKDATCVKGEPSLIDIFITNKPKRFVNIVSLNAELNNFHNMICTSTKFHLPPSRGRLHLTTEVINTSM
jgi:hypothetical protein